MKLIISILLFTTTLYANWNEDCDARTSSVIELIREMQSEPYLESYQDFIELRDVFSRDSSLKKEFKQSSSEDKFEVIKMREGFILKKRRKDNVNEAHAWAMAQFSGSSKYIVPSFLVDIGGKKVVFQRMETFFLADKETKQSPSKILKKVSLDTYWEAHLQAYLLGLSDLVGRNIGVNAEGGIRFFDNEACFSYGDEVYKSHNELRVGFVSQSFDWPQYNQPLDRDAVKILQEFVLSLSNFEENLQIYLSNQDIRIDIEGLLYRLEKIRSFSFEEGITFFDFYAFLYPKLASGLDQLSKIASPFMGGRKGHGSALFFISRSKSRYEISNKKSREIANWIDRYVE